MINTPPLAEPVGGWIT